MAIPRTSQTEAVPKLRHCAGSFSSGPFFVRSVCALLAVLGASAPARADVASWLFVGGGPSYVQHEQDDFEGQPSLLVETGLGSTPSDPIIVGGLGRFNTHFGQGTDLGLSLRGATRGFVAGDWGAALDFGGYQRFWGVGSSGAMGSLVLGAPWGITASLTGAVGTNDARTLSGVIGIDFARLTVYRLSGENWFRNPFPAYRPESARR